MTKSCKASVSKSSLHSKVSKSHLFFELKKMKSDSCYWICSQSVSWNSFYPLKLVPKF